MVRGRAGGRGGRVVVEGPSAPSPRRACARRRLQHAAARLQISDNEKSISTKHIRALFFKNEVQLLEPVFASCNRNQFVASASLLLLFPAARQHAATLDGCIGGTGGTGSVRRGAFARVRARASERLDFQNVWTRAGH
jgi:hypothetical protein